MGHTWPWRGGTSSQDNCKVLEREMEGEWCQKAAQEFVRVREPPLDQPICGAEHPEPSQDVTGSWCCVCVHWAPALIPNHSPFPWLAGG